MRKGTILVLLVVLAVAFSGCTRIPPGYAGLKVSLLGNEKGDIQELTTGRYLNGINVEFHKFPTFDQNYVWTADETEGSKDDESFTFPVEGLTIGVDVGIAYNLEEGKIKDIFTTYRKGVEELTDVVIYNEVRNALNTYAAEYTVDTLVSGGMGELMNTVEEHVQSYFSPVGINIKSLSLVSAPRYPSSVTSAIEAKNRATQVAIQRENELRETEAKVAMDIAQTEGNAARRILDAEANAKTKELNATAQASATLIEAKASAEANLLLSRSLTPNVLEAQRLEAWDGKYPVYMLGDDASILLGN